MKKSLMVLAAVALAACTADVETDSPGSLDTTRDTSAALGIPDIDVGMKKDTVTVPVVEMRTDTLIVKKPVVTGKKQVEVSRPTVDVNRKP